jgi:hypothetical protein
MILAVRGIIEVFREAGRAQELDREILAFSISHDNASVRIYGHYAVVGNVVKGVATKTQYYRHQIRSFPFMENEDRWTAYRFTKNLYDEFMPKHLDRIRKVIDTLPLRGKASSEPSQGTKRPVPDDDESAPPLKRGRTSGIWGGGDGGDGDGGDGDGDGEGGAGGDGSGTISGVAKGVGGWLRELMSGI